MMTRRTWIGGGLATLLTGLPASASDDVWAKVQARATAGRLPALAGTETDHYQSRGDAGLDYQKEALDLAESFAADAMAHFRGKGFALDWPNGKLPVVILASETSYVAFEQGEVGQAEGGYFDLDNHWLVTFDFRPRPGVPRGLGANDPRIDNTLTLVHEAFHQWSYSTGLLASNSDTPLALIEGLATYAETWGPKRRGVIGQTNTRRQRGLQLGRQHGVGWIAVPRLLTEDKFFDDSKTEQVAYAVASLLTHRLLKDARRLEQFRSYLAAVRTNTDTTRRLSLLTEHFGDLAKLDAEVRNR